MERKISLGELLRIRLAGSDARQDGMHLAVVFESGGMRNISSGGIVSEFEKYGLAGTFDTFHGSSSGACVALYFAAERAEDGVKVLMEDINNREFINILDLFSREAVVNTRKIVRDVIGGLRDPGMNAKVRSALYVVATSLRNGRPVRLSGFRSRSDLLDAIEGTMKIPNIHRSGFPIAEMLLVDGGISASIPLFSAIEAGATHVLVICNQKRSAYRRRPMKTVAEALLLILTCGFATAREYLRARNGFRGEVAVPGVDVEWLLMPEDSPSCSVIEVREDRLQSRFEMGRSIAQGFLEKCGLISI